LERIEAFTMSGRGGKEIRGGRGSRLNRSSGRFARGDNGTTNTKKKKSIEDYYYYIGSSKQAADYNLTTEHVINHIKKEYDRGIDIAEALRTGEEPDMSNWQPRLGFSLSQDPTTKAAEDEQYKMLFKAELDEYMKRKRVYSDNKIKAYAFIWDRCAKAMQAKIQARSDFESKVYNDPLELLNAIREHAMNFQETRYEMSIISDAFRALFNAKQAEGENLTEYTRKFKAAKDILVSHVGAPLNFAKYVKTMDGYNANDTAKVEVLTKQAQEQFLAFLFLENADQNKYGSLLTNLNSQKSLGNDQYPKTIVDACEVLSNHKFDNANRANKKREQKGKGDGNQKHANAKEDESVVLSFAQLEGKCYCCGKPGHKSPVCNKKDKIPKDEWAINKSQQQFVQEQKTQASNSSTKNSDDSNVKSEAKNEPTAGWTGLHYSFAQSNSLRDCILLDSDSTDTIFCNKEYVTNIRDSPTDMVMNTNGGPMVTKQLCDVPFLGTVWFNENSLTNIISLALMAEKHRVTYDSSAEKAFLVHLPHKVVKFYQLSSRLYGMNPKETNKVYTQVESKYVLGQLRDDNLKLLSARQQAAVKKVRQLHHALGTPSLGDLKAMIRMNLIRNNTVTTKDVNLAERVYGPDVGTRKGKSTRRKPNQVVDASIELPDELMDIHDEVTVSLDGMEVNSLKFVTTIAHDLYYRTAQYISKPVKSQYVKVLDELHSVYKNNGFVLGEIHCDNEFRPVMTDWAISKDPVVKISYANPQDHVPRAERNNRVLQERVRAMYHHMPYEHLPRILVKYLVMEAARKMNYFPARYGISKHYSPRMIVHKENIDYERHCRYAIGDYVLAPDEPIQLNTNAPRMIDCIYLRPTAGTQGGHELLHLQTNKVITRPRVTPVPITPNIIAQVHAIAETDGMPKGLKIKNRTNRVLFDTTWSAGVDYDEAFDDEDYDQDEEEEVEEEGEEEYEAEEIDENEIADLLAEANEEYIDNQENQFNEEENEEQDEQEVNAEEILLEESDLEYQDSNQEDEELVPDNESEEETPTLRRSARVRVPNPRYQHLTTSDATIEEYSTENASLIANIMMHYNVKLANCDDKQALSFLQTYSLKAGLKKFGEAGKEATMKEMRQLHDRVVFKPIRISEMTSRERKRAMESLIFLVEKRDGRIKARTCANGSTQRDYIPREDAASPTASTEAVLLTGVIDAKQRRDVMTLDIPNAFVQTKIPEGEEKIIMKIRGALVDILCEIAPEVYQEYVIQEGKDKVLYVHMLKALYGMLVASLLYYKKFRKDIEDIGYKINPYDMCVANKMVNGKQHTLVWHVDDVKASHVDPKVNDDFYNWCESTYGSEETGHVTVTRGKKHDYLAMTLDYTEDGKLRVDMRDYVKGMIEEFPAKLTGQTATPWTERLMKIDKTSKKLDAERAGTFHTFVMKAMFLCKRGRPDISMAICFLATRVKEPTESDWNKLLKVMNFLKKTENDVLTLEADDTQTLKWYLDAAFAVHPDMKSQTGSAFTLGKGAIISSSTKQKTNARSSTEAELNGVDDQIGKVLWTKRFLEAQGFEVKLNIIYQDNQSTMKLAKNGKASSGKRTRHFDIKLFYVTDLIGRGEVQVSYCPTDEMIADYNTKPLVGSKFVKFRDLIMNLSDIPHLVGQQECVGKQIYVHMKLHGN
jgi:hypothetical protein